MRNELPVRHVTTIESAGLSNSGSADESSNRADSRCGWQGPKVGSPIGFHIRQDAPAGSRPMTLHWTHAQLRRQSSCSARNASWSSRNTRMAIAGAARSGVEPHGARNVAPFIHVGDRAGFES